MAREWVFDERLQRWRWPNTGRLVPHSRVNSVYERMLTGYRSDIAKVTERLASDQISVRQWQMGMKALVKDMHLEARSLAMGGRNGMTFRDYGKVGRKLRDEYGRLGKFGQEIANGKLTPGQIRMRAQLYGEGNPRNTLHGGREDGHRAAGFQEKRRVIQSSNPCPTCEGQASYDWVSIDSGDVTQVGEDTECNGNDHCAIDYRWSSESMLPPRVVPQLTLVRRVV